MTAGGAAAAAAVAPVYIAVGSSRIYQLSFSYTWARRCRWLIDIGPWLDEIYDVTI
jgi:hypothetical protein